jgi:hypothetical protein
MDCSYRRPSWRCGPGFARRGSAAGSVAAFRLWPVRTDPPARAPRRRVRLVSGIRAAGGPGTRAWVAISRALASASWISRQSRGGPSQPVPRTCAACRKYLAEQFRRHSRVPAVPARVHRVQVRSWRLGGSHLESSPVRGGWSGGRAGGQGHGGGVGVACLVQPADADLAAGVVALQGALDVRGRGDLVAADGGDLVAGLQAGPGGG